MREGLKNLYSVIKDCDEWLKFVFVTKFSKVSLFSGLNNLDDISLIYDYASICGYEETEIKDIFFDRLEGVDFDLLRRWYNGYNFLGTSVYNPFEVLLYLKYKNLRNYWFETATPSFLVKLIQQKQYFLPNLENIKTTENLLGSFDIIEFKLINQPEKVLEQIKQRRYFEKYQDEPAAIYLVGVEFNPEDKNIDSFEWEMM
ncbi:AAA family ATPase [Candidatus Marithrix sp. Canyon 246]|nr:AAA family ATPase [Candidatus Marithrix sp. Canyon 246]